MRDEETRRERKGNTASRQVKKPVSKSVSKQVNKPVSKQVNKPGIRTGKMVRRIALGAVAGLSVLIISGCQEPDKGGSRESTYQSENILDTGNGENVPNVQSKDKYDANELINSSDLQGDVTEFTDSGCAVNQVVSKDGGQTAVITAPGNEDAGTNVNITYREGCIFELAVINRMTEQADISEASAADIKKQTKILVFGECEDTENYTADRVVILRYE